MKSLVGECNALRKEHDSTSELFISVPSWMEVVLGTLKIYVRMLLEDPI